MALIYATNHAVDIEAAVVGATEDVLVAYDRHRKRH